jgi:hypothetical protein
VRTFSTHYLVREEGCLCVFAPIRMNNARNKSMEGSPIPKQPITPSAAPVIPACHGRDRFGGVEKSRTSRTVSLFCPTALNYPTQQKPSSMAIFADLPSARGSAPSHIAPRARWLWCVGCHSRIPGQSIAPQHRKNYSLCVATRVGIVKGFVKG